MFFYRGSGAGQTGLEDKGTIGDSGGEWKAKERGRNIITGHRGVIGYV